LGFPYGLRVHATCVDTAGQTAEAVCQYDCRQYWWATVMLPHWAGSLKADGLWVSLFLPDSFRIA